MKSLLVLMSVVGAAMCQWGQPGLPQDTPEVAAAKAAHYAALARAGSPVQAAAPSWNSAPSWTSHSASGVPQDTPEVAAAKAAHFAALAQVQGHQPQQQQWASQQSWAPAPQQSWAPQTQQWSSEQTARWTGPVALPPGYDQNGAPLPVQDTPEVVAERARHFNLYSSGGHPSLAPAQPTWNSAPAQPTWNSAQQWASAPAVSQWSSQAQSGLPQDTPEVAAAKAAHLAVHAQLAPTHGRWKRSLVAVPAVSAISAHSTSIVHSAPIVHATPIVHSAPLVHTTPYIHAAPIVRTVPIVHAAPIALTHW